MSVKTAHGFFPWICSHFREYPWRVGWSCFLVVLGDWFGQSADPKRSQEKLFDPEVEFTYSEARNVAMQQSMFSHVTVFIQLVVYTIWIHAMFIQSGWEFWMKNHHSFCIVYMLISSRDGSTVVFPRHFAGSRRFLQRGGVCSTLLLRLKPVLIESFIISRTLNAMVKSYGKVYRRYVDESVFIVE